MPELTLPCLTSQGTVNLATLGGRPLLLNLWASWCDPCREEVPVLQSASLRYADRVTFVGVDTRDTPGPAAGLLRQFDVTYPQLADPEEWPLLGAAWRSART